MYSKTQYKDDITSSFPCAEKVRSIGEGMLLDRRRLLP